MEISLEPAAFSERSGVHVVPFSALETALRAWDSCDGSARPLGSSVIPARPVARCRNNDDIRGPGPLRAGTNVLASFR
jgi:hypothetical protein